MSRRPESNITEDEIENNADKFTQQKNKQAWNSLRRFGHFYWKYAPSESRIWFQNDGIVSYIKSLYQFISCQIYLLVGQSKK
jgi:hypothetical protein